jgi:hypothetical protein
MNTPTPEQLARVRSVDERSPLAERAGATLLGAYLPKTAAEARAIVELIALLSPVRLSPVRRR